MNQPAAQNEGQLRALMIALSQQNLAANPDWNHPDPRIREILRHYLSIWKEAERRQG